MTPGSPPTQPFCHGDVIRRLRSLQRTPAFVFLVINQVELLKKVRFKGALRNDIAENELPLVESQENHVFIYLANQLCVASRPASSVQRLRRVQRCNKQQGNFANT